MPKITFKIGEAFPASDPVARFITVLGMMSNDWLRSIAEMLALDDADQDSEGGRLSLFRQQASLHHEAATFIRDARRRFSEIDDFIASLSTVAQEECAQVVGGDTRDPPRDSANRRTPPRARRAPRPRRSHRHVLRLCAGSRRPRGVDGVTCDTRPSHEAQMSPPRGG